MNLQTALIWSWLNVLNKKRYDDLLQVYANMEEALEHIDERMLKGLGCRDDTVMTVMNRLEEFDPAAYEQELEKRDLTFINIEDDLYPDQLKEVPDAPVFLYFRGDLSILNQPCIALVGTREMSTYGKRVVESFVPEFVQSGIVTVSGLAFGIDAQVARSTIDAGGRTVAVLGHGLSKIYPRENSRLAEDIAENGGLILSEFPLDQPPDKYTFPARNRIIAGLSLGTVVIEAGEGSGAIITADLALEYNRDVFAVPGPIFDQNYIGCHQIIADGRARLVSEPKDVMDEIGVHVVGAVHELPLQRSYTPTDAIEKAIYGVLTTMPQSVTDLVEKSAVDAGTINANLTMMELAGAAKNVGGGLWVKN